MRLVNALCRLVEVAAEQGADAQAAQPEPIAVPAADVVPAADGHAGELLLFPDLGPLERRRAPDR
jgi:hypothetical protein